MEFSSSGTYVAPLPPRLDEFRTALQEEIEFARRNAAATAVPLAAGQRIAQVGARFHYLFTMVSALNLASDTPGALYTLGRPPIEVDVVEIRGMSITLSSPDDLGSILPEARLQVDLSQLMRRLIGRIESMATGSNSAGDRILAGEPVTGRILPFDHPLLNLEQREAVGSALGRDTTFIWGPPGTGKTHTIGALCAELYKRGRSVLVVSHTNTAVDGALLKVANALGGELESGKVLRVGNPVDPELTNREDFLLTTHVKKRERSLGERLNVLKVEVQSKSSRVLELQRLGDILDWTMEAERSIPEMATELEYVATLRKDAEHWRRTLANLAEKELVWSGVAEMARANLVHRSEAKELSRSLQLVRRELSELTQQSMELRSQLDGEEKILDLAEALEPIRVRARELGMESAQKEVLGEVGAALARLSEEQKLHAEELSEAERLYQQAIASKALVRLWKGLPEPRVQFELVNRLRAKLEAVSADVHWLRLRKEDAEAKLREINSLDFRLRDAKSVPVIEMQRHQVDLLRSKVSRLGERMDDLLRTESRVLQDLEKKERLIIWFESNYQGSPESLLDQSDAFRVTLNEARRECARIEPVYNEKSLQLRVLLRSRVEALRRYNLIEGVLPLTMETMFSAIEGAFRRASALVDEVRQSDLTSDIDLLNAEIRALEEEEALIEYRLKRLEEDIVREALVIATTLTRAYLRDSLQARRFDTVVLDEASMAPIPALWVAAGLADLSVIVVGDFRQLPPVVLSQHPLAQKWLGRDIFEVADIKSKFESGGFPEALVQLRSQHRMHPEISRIANDLVYDGRLRDAPRMEESGEEVLSTWCQRDWGYDRESVLLVDTGSIDAWVTSVPRGSGSSRMNLLSAGLCTEIAGRLFRKDRPRLSPGDAPRLLICSPYRPHAHLLSLLLKKQELNFDALAGTAHTFQGKEADIVIVDLVNDDPHWRVGLFNPEFDDTAERLFNVAITRARRRLIIVGDLSYIRARARRAFLGARFLPLLETSYKRVEAKELLDAFVKEEGKRGPAGHLVPHGESVALLRSDIEGSQERVAVYVPVVSQTILDVLGPALRRARERAVTVLVFTKPPEESGKMSKQGRDFEKVIRSWDVEIVHKLNMRERLAVIDDRIVWFWLSGDKQPDVGLAIRWESTEIARECLSALRTAEAFRAYQEGELECPICGSEMVAAEGLKEPLYWRCEQDDCYTRNVGQPFLRGGVIVCSKCSGSVEYGEWGGEPHWRCLNNRHHRQRVAKSHLKLPQMRSLIPKREIRSLERFLGIDRSA